MGDIWTEALEEAYASAPAGVESWDTLEINHPAFESPVRVVLDYGEKIGEIDDGDGYTQDVYGRMLKLEGDAPFDPGETVAFLATAFEVRRPDQSPEHAPEMSIMIDNVPGDLMAALGPAATSGQSVDVIYREYLSDDPDTVHFRIAGLKLHRVSATTLRIEGRLGFTDLFRRSFPNEYYNAADNPSLARA